MTPKEKAQELCNHYSKLVMYGTNAFDKKLAPEVLTFVKKCALIAVDEILKENLELPDEPETVIRYLFWQKVKNEIEAL